MTAIATPALAQEALNGADTAWILTSTALVLFMTLPGLALFYGGLVRSRHVLSVLMHCMTIACLASILWLAVGYSLAFSDGGGANAVVGGILGTLLTAVFALPALGGLGLPEGATVVSQLGVQALGAGAAALWAGLASFVILKAILAWIGLRADAEQETEGLDVTVHGEHAYDY
jgi:ammonia channel protein AmtB